VFIHEHGQVLLEYDNDDHLIRHNLYGTAVDQLLATDVLEYDEANDIDVPEHLIWALTDHLGSVRDVYSTSLNSGNAEHIQYNSFGVPIDPEDSAVASLVRQRHAGREYDSETGFYYNRARYYDPESQRFISPDPIGFAGGDTNLYRYVGNSPTNGTDPSGNTSFWSDPLEWAYGNEGAIWDVNASNSGLGGFYQDYLGEGIRNVLGDQYLTQAGGWELVGATTALVTAGVFTAWAAPGVFGVSGLAASIYGAKQIGVAGLETLGEYSVAYMTGDDSFSLGGSFARNAAFNLTVGLLPGAAESKAVSKISSGVLRYGAHYASEVAVNTAFDTAWEVGYNGRSIGDAFTQSIVGNSLGQGFGDIASAGLRRVFSAETLGGFRVCFAAGTLVWKDSGEQQPIETLQLGQRVQRESPAAATFTMEPSAYRKIILRDPNQTDVVVELLRPASWLDEHRAMIGSSIFIDLPEMHISGELLIKAIDACPAIESSLGNLITGRFSHLAHDLLDVYVEGLAEPIRCTERHPFWSVTRQAWIAANELQTGELLDIGQGQTAQVVSVGLVAESQRRSVPNFQQAVALAHGGKLGKVHTMFASVYTPSLDNTWLPAESTPPRDVVDWNLWLGPAPWRPYNQQYVQGRWRGQYDFDSGAKLLDWGAHTVDLCQWGNHADDTLPIEYVPNESNVTCLYANGVKLVLDFLKTPFAERPGWIQKLGTCPVRFVGEAGWVETGDSGEIEVSSETLKSELKQGEKKVVGLDVSAHARNFFDCVKSRAATAANPNVMRNSHIACHAAALAWMLQRKLQLDPATATFVNDAEANSLRSRPSRDPWKV
jgi:RHS repeat-associated protein